VKLRTTFGMDCAPVAGSAGFDHMPQTGISGFDLYVGENGQETMCSVARFPTGSREYSCKMFQRTGRKPLSFTLNFPLFNGVNELFLGLRKGALLRAPPPYRLNRPVVVYGTSITHGGYASRPGACYTNILSRRLNVPFVNLGFSGSGRGEPEVAEAVAQVRNPALFVLDYEANSRPEELPVSLPRFIAILRARHTTVPILVVSKIRYASEAVKSEPASCKVRESNKRFQKKMVGKLRAAGDRHIHFLDGSMLLGKDYHECSVDGAHPTDLGFYRMAAGLGPTIKKLLCAR
jgi:hypothetical protein